jgi:cytochrome c biogenesis protein CcdA
MAKSTISSSISFAAKFLILTAFIGSVILVIGKHFYPETPVKEYLTLTTILAIILALVIFAAMRSLKKR